MAPGASLLRGGGVRLGWLRLGWLGALVLLSLGTASGARAEPTCGPFEARYAAASDGAASAEAGGSGASASAEPGVTGAASGSDASADRGRILELREAAPQAPPAPAAEVESEAILALPKDETGAIPDDYELGPGARIRQSFFSPVVCATIARITGPAGAPLEQLVTVVPETATVVPNDVYRSAAAELRAAPVEVVAPPRPDPYAPLQYGLALSGVRAARALGDGAGVRVALLDSAPETTHRDLDAARIRSGSAEAEPAPVGVHGTLMAGVIAAVEDNGFGIAGLAPGAEIVSIPVCRPRASSGECTVFDLLRGFDQAWESESALVNLALSGPPNALLERGVARLEELGLVVVAAAGNEGTDSPRYPAAYPSVVGVGAIDREGRAFVAGNHGPWVELLAPGVEILSTVPGNAFAFGDGTSLAAAHVTGVLAVLAGVLGDAKQARAALFATALATRVRPGPVVPPVCEVLAQGGTRCAATPAEAQPSPPAPASSPPEAARARSLASSASP